jgi:hypothetical protein
MYKLNQNDENDLAVQRALFQYQEQLERQESYYHKVRNESIDRILSETIYISDRD